MRRGRRAESGMAPEIVSPISKPRLVRAASSSMPCRRTSASASFRALRYSRLIGAPPILTSPLSWKPCGLAVARSIADSTFCPMIIRSAAKFVVSTETRIIGRAGRQIGLERHAERDLGAQIAAHRRGVERRVGHIAQPIHARCSSAAACTGPSILKCTRAGGACGEVSGTSNTPLVKRELAPGRHIGGRLADRNNGVAADDVHVHVGIAERRQAVRPGGQRNRWPKRRSKDRRREPAARCL